MKKEESVKNLHADRIWFKGYTEGEDKEHRKQSLLAGMQIFEDLRSYITKSIEDIREDLDSKVAEGCSDEYMRAQHSKIAGLKQARSLIPYTD